MLALSPFPLRAAAAGLLLVLALSLACDTGGSAEEEPAATDGGIIVRFPTPAGQVTPRPRRTLVPTPAPSPTPLKVCAPNPDPAPPNVLQVTSPAPEQRVKMPFYVSGWGSGIGFQNQGVAVAVVNSKQEVVQVLDVPPQPRTYRVPPPGLDITDNTRPFGADIVINNLREPTEFCIWVYLQTDDQGRPKGVVQVPIVVLP
jgi:hypothetical protein